MKYKYLTSYIAAILILLTMSCVTSKNNNVDTDEVIFEASQELMTYTDEKTIGIGDIKLLGTGIVSNFSIYLSNKLASKLLRLGYTVADRDNLNQLKEEWKHQLSFSDEDTTVEIARTNGISALVVGDYSIGKKDVNVQLKLIDTQSGLILGTTEFNIPVNLVSQHLNSMPNNSLNAFPSITSTTNNRQPVTSNTLIGNTSIPNSNKSKNNKTQIKYSFNDKYSPGQKLKYVLSENKEIYFSFAPTLSKIPEYYPYRSPGTYKVENYPVRIIDDPKPFWIGETEVTVETWNIVVSWAEENGYIFSDNPLRDRYVSNRNYNQYPVPFLSWRDAMLFCNAITEYLNSISSPEDQLLPVYYQDMNLTMPIRQVDSTEVISYYEATSPSGTQDDPYVNHDAGGFRLPTITEWTIAARYKGDYDRDGGIVSLGEFFDDNCVSGSSNSDWNNKKLYAGAGSKVFETKIKKPNALGLYDISGNANEWCYDWTGKYWRTEPEQAEIKGQWKYLMGGTYDNYGGVIELNLVSQVYPNHPKPYFMNGITGMRLAKNVN